VISDKALARIENRREIVKRMPGKMPQFVAYLHEKEAVEKCREWKD
jgi:hypothetical protein